MQDDVNLPSPEQQPRHAAVGEATEELPLQDLPSLTTMVEHDITSHASASQHEDDEQLSSGSVATEHAAEEISFCIDQDEDRALGASMADGEQQDRDQRTAHSSSNGHTGSAEQGSASFQQQLEQGDGSEVVQTLGAENLQDGDQQHSRRSAAALRSKFRDESSSSEDESHAHDLPLRSQDQYRQKDSASESDNFSSSKDDSDSGSVVDDECSHVQHELSSHGTPEQQTAGEAVDYADQQALEDESSDQKVSVQRHQKADSAVRASDIRMSRRQAAAKSDDPAEPAPEYSPPSERAEVSFQAAAPRAAASMGGSTDVYKEISHLASSTAQEQGKTQGLIEATSPVSASASRSASPVKQPEAPASPQSTSTKASSPSSSRQHAEVASAAAGQLPLAAEQLRSAAPCSPAGADLQPDALTSAFQAACLAALPAPPPAILDHDRQLQQQLPLSDQWWLASPSQQPPQQSFDLSPGGELPLTAMLYAAEFSQIARIVASIKSFAVQSAKPGWEHNCMIC